MKAIYLWTWLIMLAARPLLPKTHSLKARWITLADWAAGSTDLLFWFSVNFWLFFFGIIGAIIIVVRSAY